MRQLATALLVLLAIHSDLSAQSLEAMAGSKGGSADVEFLRTLLPDSKLTVFGRNRAKITYGNEADLFSALYLNYTSPAFIGPTITARAQNGEASGDLGVHAFRGTKRLTLFSLLSAEMKSQLGVSWFGLIRYRHEIASDWNVYAAAESFSLWRKAQGHIISVQRVRLGVERKGWAFGGALDATMAGSDWNASYNPAIFLRRNL